MKKAVSNFEAAFLFRIYLGRSPPAGGSGYRYSHPVKTGVLKQAALSLTQINLRPDSYRDYDFGFTILELKI
ncbi:MAG: hypothetical protein Q7U21_11075 [Lutibacter sp.]|nr:hypothetical protein [Lutibacter sp.]